MKQFKLNNLPIITLLITILAGCASGPEFIVLGSSNAPGSDGTAEIEELDDGGETLITIHMEHLLPPRHLGDELTAYVMWFLDKKGAPLKAGVMSYKAESRTGDVLGTSSTRQFKVQITAETSEDVKTPSKFVIVDYTPPSN